MGGVSPGKTELHPDILRRAAIFVEFPPKTRIEGEIQSRAPDHLVTGFCRVLTGQTPGRADAGQITLFDSVGFAIEDFAALKLVRARAIEAGFYQELDFVADPDGPRDLFGMLMRAG